MQLVDWLIVLAYLAVTLAIGIYLSRRASGSMEDFFVSGRNLPWWLAGTSMAATTFSIDTPLYVAGVVGTRGIAGNWEWWSFAFAHIILIYIFSRLWSRARIVTDNELTEIRYGGAPAAILRATKGFLFAVVIGSIGISLAMLAMVKVVDALDLFGALGLEVGDHAKLWTVVGVSVFVLVYAGLAGLWGVVATDFFQFFLGLLGAITVAVIAVVHIGGLGEMAERAQALTDFDILSFTPIVFGEGPGWTFNLIGWSEFAGITFSTFFAYTVVQWWAFRRSDGGGEFVQRLAGCRSEDDAEKAAWFFNIMHYVVRTWPWIIVALVGVALYPDIEDPELIYPTLMLDHLPPVVLGLVVASLVAAFMSTVSTLINWSASYMTNDLYHRFVRPAALQPELVLAGRVASVIVTFIGATAAFFADDVMWIFRLIIAVGTGPGLVLILRWFWWRINAWAEWASMVAGFLIGFATTIPNPIYNLQIDDFGIRLLTISGITFVIWFTTMLLTRPESEEKLEAFYRRVRPPGPGWRRFREKTGLEPEQKLSHDVMRVLAALMLLFGLMFFVGGLLLLRPFTALAWGVIAAVGYGFLLVLRKRGGRRWEDRAPAAPNGPAPST
jgi:solute:Na+ symporter, SSS family